ncbi:hypothetical protein ACFRFQ_01145 [Rhodococcus sp. NPDC056743]|uniref:hypothetical protein n=1 Tax=Rhodococcus sp. NPDC056743 TaxID=3345934 RepID=UPI00367010A5
MTSPRTRTHAYEGADVVLSDLDEEDADAQETANWVEQVGRKAIRVRTGDGVNAIAPEPIWIPLIPARMPKEKFESYGR